jgi:choline dehydrogenase
MLSGIGDKAELDRFDIPLVHHLPGVGQNLRDHVSFSCVREYLAPIAPRNAGAEATLYWKSSPDLDSPNLLFCQAEFPFASPGAASRGIPSDDWTMAAGIAQPKSPDLVHLTRANLLNPVRIERTFSGHPDDIKAVLLAYDCAENRAIHLLLIHSRSASQSPEITGEDMAAYVRDAAQTCWHQTRTAKMGSDSMSVADNMLRSMALKTFGLPTDQSCLASRREIRWRYA